MNTYEGVSILQSLAGLGPHSHSSTLLYISCRVCGGRGGRGPTDTAKEIAIHWIVLHTIHSGGEDCEQGFILLQQQMLCCNGVHV